ncbi:MAG: hypothetical protein H0U75_12605 [Legionella sp.]|nr:hypothetical protein [Legionella sp.]
MPLETKQFETLPSKTASWSSQKKQSYIDVMAYEFAIKKREDQRKITQAEEYKRYIQPFLLESRMPFTFKAETHGVSDVQLLTPQDTLVESLTIDVEFKHPKTKDTHKCKLSAHKITVGHEEPFITMEHHGSSGNEDNKKLIRTCERSVINRERIKLLDRHKDVHHIFILADTNEDAYEEKLEWIAKYEYDESVQEKRIRLSEKLSEVATQMVHSKEPQHNFIADIGVPEKLVLKQRGLVKQGRYLGPNLYMNQQPGKDGVSVLASRMLIIHSCRHAVQHSFETLINKLKAKPTPPIINFNEKNGGFNDHFPVTYTASVVNANTGQARAYTLIANANLPTEGVKGFKNISDIYNETALGRNEHGNIGLKEEVLDAQTASTKELYTLLGKCMGVSLCNFNEPPSVYYFVSKLRDQIVRWENNEDIRAYYVKSLETWINSAAFQKANSYLTDEHKFRLSATELASISYARGSTGNIEPLNKIGECLDAQVFGGYTIINGSTAHTARSVNEEQAKSLATLIAEQTQIHPESTKIVMSTESSKKDKGEYFDLIQLSTIDRQTPFFKRRLTRYLQNNHRQNDFIEGLKILASKIHQQWVTILMALKTQMDSSGFDDMTQACIKDEGLTKDIVAYGNLPDILYILQKTTQPQNALHLFNALLSNQGEGFFLQNCTVFTNLLLLMSKLIMDNPTHLASNKIFNVLEKMIAHHTNLFDKAIFENMSQYYSKSRPNDPTIPAEIQLITRFGQKGLYDLTQVCAHFYITPQTGWISLSNPFKKDPEALYKKIAAEAGVEKTLEASQNGWFFWIKRCFARFFSRPSGLVKFYDSNEMYQDIRPIIPSVHNTNPPLVRTESPSSKTPMPRTQNDIVQALKDQGLFAPTNEQGLTTTTDASLFSNGL